MRLLSIGKSPSCNIRINSEFVSSYHAELLLMDNGDIFLIDCNSTNGTFVQGNRIKPNVEVPVRRGDKIEFDQEVLHWGEVPTIPIPDPAKVKGVYGIGKSQRNRYCLPGDSVSRYHATFKEMKNGKWFIQDHSRNGTFINGQRIPSNQDVPVKAGDQIICGSVSCPNPIKGGVKIPVWVWGVVAAVLVVAGIGFGLSKIPLGPVGHKIDPAKATVFIRQDFILKVNFSDNPFKAQTGLDLYLSYSPGAGYGWTVSPSEAYCPGYVTGTGFFISDKGHILTNRHVTNYTWADKHYNGGRESQPWINIVEKMRPYLANNIYEYFAEHDWTITRDDAYTFAVRMLNSSVELESVPTIFYIGYSGRNYTLYTEMDKATLLKEATDENVDMALLQLNNPVTPAYADYFRTQDAIVDVKKLSKTAQYYTIGFPAGLQESRVSTATMIQPTSGQLHLVQEPGEYQLAFQGDKTIGGQSGSAIFDAKNRLIGVLWGGRTATENTMATPIVHAKTLYRDF